MTGAQAVLLAHGISTESGLLALLERPPADLTPDAVDTLRSLRSDSVWVMREHAIAHLPTDLRWLFEAGALTLEQFLLLTSGLDVVSLGDMALAVRRGSLREMAGLGAEAEAAVARTLPTLRSRVSRIALGRALAAAEPLLSLLRAFPDVGWAQPTGSLRRGHDSVGDVEILVDTESAPAVLDEISASAEVESVLFRGDRRICLVAGQTQVGIRCTPRSGSATTLLHLTGSAPHLTRLRQLATDRRMTLEPEGLRVVNGRTRPTDTEEEIYAALGLPFIPPELRNGDDEIERARLGTLPDLVERRDIRGDLHMHSTWSDGRDSIEAMVRASIALGYDYLAITDHSPSSAASRNLSREDVGRQAEEIARVREQYPQIAILHGCEVDILADGRLDFPDRTLRRFDLVLASLHDRAGHSPQQLLRRYLSAMLHPLVLIVTHPTNRLFPRRAGYDIDFNLLFEAAVETGTILEIDGAPTHIDLDASLAARAIAAGVTLAIDSDCHAADRLERHMQIGLLTARRAGVEPRHVLNTRLLPEIRALIAAKRGHSLG